MGCEVLETAQSIRREQVSSFLMAHQHIIGYTQGEMTSQNLWSLYDRHFVGITWHNVWS